MDLRKTRVKRRVRKARVNSEGRSSYYSSEDSRSCDSAFEIKFEKIYENNEQGDPADVNMGFEIQPLDPTIYGKSAARKSQIKHYKMKS